MDTIATTLRQVARKRGIARPLSREQAAVVMAAILDGQISDIELGAFCIAMRLKGERVEELLGFLDAVHARLHRVRSADGRPVIVIPSYNGARRLPVFTPLLALLLARAGHAVLVHGSATETLRVGSQQVFAGLGIASSMPDTPIAAGKVHFVPTQALCAGLKRLIDVRLWTGLRNSGHSLVKLMNPVGGPACLMASYTHGEYAQAMSGVFTSMQTTGLLMHGIEGEPVADGRRFAEMQAFVGGRALPISELVTLSDQVDALPSCRADAENTVALIRAVLADRLPVPQAIANQIKAVEALQRLG